MQPQAMKVHELPNSSENTDRLFRMNLLKSDSTSSLSELMREIEKNQSSEFDEEIKSREVLDRQVQRQQMMQAEGDGDTSVDSMMEDTPANYNIPNQRFEENYDEYSPIPEEGQGGRTEGKPRRNRPAPQHMQTDGTTLT